MNWNSNNSTLSQYRTLRNRFEQEWLKNTTSEMYRMRRSMTLYVICWRIQNTKLTWRYVRTTSAIRRRHLWRKLFGGRNGYCVTPMWNFWRTPPLAWVFSRDNLLTWLPLSQLSSSSFYTLVWEFSSIWYTALVQHMPPWKAKNSKLVKSSSWQTL